MKYKVVELIAPSAWASYLINGDDSGIAQDDKSAADAWLERQGLQAPVSCEPYGFAWQHDAFKECPYGAECETYSFLLEDEKAKG